MGIEVLALTRSHQMPDMWLTGISGKLLAQANAFAAAIPTKIAPTNQVRKSQQQHQGH